MPMSARRQLAYGAGAHDAMAAGRCDGHYAARSRLHFDISPHGGSIGPIAATVGLPRVDVACLLRQPFADLCLGR